MVMHDYISGLRERLRACTATNQELADAADLRISPSWISKFRADRAPNPRSDSLVALDDALRIYADNAPAQAQRAA